MKVIFIGLLVLCFSFQLSSQVYTLDTYQGTVYKFPSKLSYTKFLENYKDFPIVAEINWKRIDKGQRNVETGFPQVPNIQTFGIMFFNTLYVHEKSNFRFSLTSDDGTILWIDEEEIINNDYSNGMHTKEDTLFLDKGEYDLKIWYFQAYPTKMGVIFDMDSIQGEVPDLSKSYQFQSKLLFASNSSSLQKKAYSSLDSLVKELSEYKNVRMTIIGHTDNVGSLEYNYELSKERTETLKKYFLKKKIDFISEISCKAMSFTKPLDTNDTEEGREKNRRVELMIEAYKD